MNWATHERVGRELEIEFHHATVGGGLIRPGGHERPGRGAKDWEEQQRGRTGIDPAEVKRQATAIWRSADSGRSFQAGLAAAGLILARGDKPGAVVLIDTQGGVHGLGRRIEGVRAAEIKTRLADLDPSTLPSVQEVRAGLKEKDGDQAAKGPDRTTPKQWTPSRKAHPGHLPRPSGLRARRSFGGRNNAFLFGAERDRIGRLGGRASVEPPTSRSQTATLIDVTLPDDRPGIDPLEVLNAIQQLKKAIGAGANLGEGLKRMEALYGRLMLNG